MSPRTAGTYNSPCLCLLPQCWDFAALCDQHLPGARPSYLCLLCCPDAFFPPQVSVTGVELSPPVTFRLRAGSGPVFLSGLECYGKLYPGYRGLKGFLTFSTAPPKQMLASGLN